MLTVFTAILLIFKFSTVQSYDLRCFRSDYDGNVIILKHTDDCRKFYKCDQNFRIVEKQCPPMLEFDPNLKICDWPKGFCAPNSNTPVDNVMNCNGLPDNAYQPDYDDDCRSFYFCNNGVARSGRCVPNTRFDITSGKCINENLVQCRLASTKSRRGGDHIDCRSQFTNSSLIIANIEDNCKSYYLCSNGQPVRHYCKGSQIFNENKQFCDWPQSVNCGKPVAVPSAEFGDFKGFDCQQYPEGHLIGPNRNSKCASYFLCRNNEMVEEYCSEALVFNPELGICDYADNVRGCQLTEQRTNLINCDLKEKTIHKHPDDCASFIRCNYGRSQINSCPSGYVFDEIEGKCLRDIGDACELAHKPRFVFTVPESPDSLIDINVASSYPNFAKGCRTYFTCENGRCHEEQCRLGTAFDSVIFRCIENAYCHDHHTTVKTKGRAVPDYIDCSVKQGHWYPDEEDCTKFYVCALGSAYRQQCHSGQYFDRKRGLCLEGSTSTCNPDPGQGNKTTSCGGYKHGEILPDMLNDDKYYICENGVLKQIRCPVGSIFNQTLLDCTSGVETKSCGPLAINQTIPDLFHDRTKYYICRGPYLEHMSCNSGLEYSTDTGNCETTPTLIPPTIVPPPNCGPNVTNGTFIPDDFDERKFYVCINGILNHRTCPDGMLFNKTMGKCAGTGKGCGSISEGGKLPDAFNETKYYVCADGYLKHYSCPAGFTFNPITLQCRSTSPTTPTPCRNCGKTPEGGFVPDEQDISKFYVCYNGTLLSKTCPYDGTFDPVALVCRSNVSTTTLPIRNCGPTPDGAFLPDEFDNNKFYVCVSGVLEHRSCQKDYYFDPTKLQCISLAPTTTYKPKNCGPTPDGGFLPDEFDNTKYYVCVQGYLRHFKCPKDSYFDKSKLRCVSTIPTTTLPPSKNCGSTPEGGFVPDRFNNSKFYVCVNGTLDHKSCPPDTYFDPSTLFCETIGPTTTQEYKDCGPLPDGGFLPDKFNTSKYYVCVHGVLNHKSCPQDWYFDENALMCATISPTTTTQTKNCGSTPTGGFVPNEFDNTTFYVCNNGVLQLKSCQPDTIFDKVTMTCVPRTSSTTTSSTTTSPTTTSPTTTSPTTTSPTTTSPTTTSPTTTSSTTTSSTTTPKPDCGPVGQLYPDAMNSSWYYMCGDDGYLLHLECPGGLVFEETVLSCQPPLITPEPQECENGEMIPDEEDDTKFYVCVNNTLEKKSCPEGQTFNKTQLICIKRSNCGPLPTGSFIADSFNETNFYVCNEGVLNLKSCNVGQIFDKQLLMCVKREANLNCGDLLNGEYLEDKFNKTKFYVCVNGTLNLRDCPAGMEFDAEISMCILSATTTTTTTTSTTSTAKSCCCGPTPDRGFVPDEFNNEKFYVCICGTLRHLSCPKGDIFDKVKLQCVSNVTSTTLAPKCCGPTPDGGRVPDEFDQTKFYVCIQGTLRPFSCPANQTFNPVTRQCQSAGSTTTESSLACGPTQDGGRLPDEFNTNKYYVCIRGLLYQKNCPVGETFNADILECTSSVTTPTTKNCGPTPEGGRLPNKFDNNKFFVCVQGTLRQYSCPPGETFNPNTLLCSGSTSPTPESKSCGPTPNGGRLPDKFDTTAFYVCVDGKLRHFYCEDGHIFDESSLTCVSSGVTTPTTSQTSCGNIPSGGVLPDFFNKTKFYVCSNGVLNHKSCESQQEFDAALLMCVPVTTEQPETTTTTTTTTISSSNCGPLPNGGMLPDAFYENKFYVCVDGVLNHKTCDTGWLFDKEKLMCYNCTASPETSTTAPTTETTQTTEPSTPTPACQEEAIEPDPNDCTRYTICLLGNPITQQCDDGFYFNPTDKKCEQGTCPSTPAALNNCQNLQNGEFMADYANPQYFYICDSGILQHRQCLTGQFFDDKSMMCIKRVTAAPLQLTSVPGTSSCRGLPPGAHVRHEVDSKKFYICVLNMLLEQQCPPGFTFDAEESHCRL